MNVQELIDKLMLVEDKTMPVYGNKTIISGCCNNQWEEKDEFEMSDGYVSHVVQLVWQKPGPRGGAKGAYVRKTIPVFMLEEY